MSVGLPTNLKFLIYLVDVGMGYSSVWVFLAAILAFYSHIGVYSVFSHLVSKCFLKGLIHLRLPVK